MLQKNTAKRYVIVFKYKLTPQLFPVYIQKDICLLKGENLHFSLSLFLAKQTL